MTRNCFVKMRISGARFKSPRRNRARERSSATMRDLDRAAMMLMTGIACSTRQLGILRKKGRRGDIKFYWSKVLFYQLFGK